MNWAKSLAVPKRIEDAERRLEEVSYGTMNLIALHEINRIVVYSDQLSRKIPKSQAAIAYNLFTLSLLHNEIITLCTLWERGRRDVASLPAIVHLVNDKKVKRKIRKRHEEGFGRNGESYVVNAMANLEKGIDIVREYSNSSDFKVVKRFRDDISHRLLEPIDSEPSTDQVVEPMNYGDERGALAQTINALTLLELGVRGLDPGLQQCHEISRRQANELWGNCEFRIPGRKPLEA